MRQCDTSIVSSQGAKPSSGFAIFLRWLAFGVMLMTIPQVVSVWRNGAAGVSLASWIAYLFSSVAWLVYGIRRRDPTIWLVCIGWILVDGAVVAGILVNA
ncbi:MAG TPA: hypothetical protein VLY46_06695 [Usitatibacter sp.]|nr:hypothetical protein [Usitatibacter sp.]